MKEYDNCRLSWWPFDIVWENWQFPDYLVKPLGIVWKSTIPDYLVKPFDNVWQNKIIPDYLVNPFGIMWQNKIIPDYLVDPCAE